jgi:hypothetical protein
MSALYDALEAISSDLPEGPVNQSVRRPAVSRLGEEFMKLLGIVVGLLAICMFVGNSYAKAAKADVAAGKVTAVADKDGNIKIEKRAKAPAVAEEITVKTDASTVVTIDGAAGKVSDIAVGMNVKVSPASGVAKTIDATSKKPGAKKN